MFQSSWRIISVTSWSYWTPYSSLNPINARSEYNHQHEGEGPQVLSSHFHHDLLVTFHALRVTPSSTQRMISSRQGTRERLTVLYYIVWASGSKTNSSTSSGFTLWVIDRTSKQHMHTHSNFNSFQGRSQVFVLRCQSIQEQAHFQEVGIISRVHC